MFPTTRWTLILASRRGGEAHRAALEALLASHWRPIYVFLRRKGLGVESAEDATQGFFLHLIEHDVLPRLDPARGKLRSYLLTALEHYLVNLHEKASAVKRGGRVRFVPLDVALAERDLAGAAAPPEEAFQREWATGVLERAMGRLQRDYDEGRRKGPAEPFLRFFRLGGAPSYAEAAAASGLTIPQFKAALHRARERFRQILREEVAATVEEDGDVEAELRELFHALSG